MNDKSKIHIKDDFQLRMPHSAATSFDYSRFRHCLKDSCFSNSICLHSKACSEDCFPSSLCIAAVCNFLLPFHLLEQFQIGCFRATRHFFKPPWKMRSEEHPSKSHCLSILKEIQDYTGSPRTWSAAWVDLCFNIIYNSVGSYTLKQRIT